MRENIAALNALTTFILQDGLMVEGQPPKINEPYYDKYMAAQMTQMGLSCGDNIELDIGYAKISGTLLWDINEDISHIKLLTEGKSVWKSRKNEKTICVKDIHAVSLIKKAHPDFDIYKVNPYHTELDSHKVHNVRNSQTIKEETKVLLDAICGNITDKTVFLHILPSLFCPTYYPSYDNSITGKMIIKNAHVTMLYKDGNTKTHEHLTIKNVFPNHDYKTACANGQKQEGLLLSFDNFEEMQKIDGIGCSWRVQVDEQELVFTHIVYVEFEKHESYPIYNVIISTAPLEVHASSLSKSTVFSGRLYEEYDFAGISLNDEELIMILNDMDMRTTIDSAAVTHGSRENAILAFSNQERIYNEIFVQKQKVQGLYYLARHTDGVIKRKIDFRNIFEDRV